MDGCEDQMDGSESWVDQMDGCESWVDQMDGCESWVDELMLLRIESTTQKSIHNINF